MWTDAYDVGPIRPPSEAASLLIRVNRNCPWNKCEFCGVYKGTKFERKSVAEVKEDIDKAARLYGPGASAITSAFLQDANAILMKTEELLEVLRHLKSKFPAISRITTYGRASTVARKSADELSRLHEAGITRLHMGMETGYGPLLDYINKGTTPDELIEAGRKVKTSGISLSEYIMPGLGGKRWWRENAEASAIVLNAVDPDFIRIRSFRPMPGTPIHGKLLSGSFIPLSDEETAAEIRLFIGNLDGISSTIASDHMMNLLQEIEGRLPRDKQRLLDICDRFLGMSPDDKLNFIAGARLRIYFSLGDMQNATSRAHADSAVDKIRRSIAADPALSGITVEEYIKKLVESII